MITAAMKSVLTSCIFTQIQILLLSVVVIFHNDNLSIYKLSIDFIFLKHKKAQTMLGLNRVTIKTYFALGLNGFITVSSHSRNGPSIKSIQYGIAGNTASKHSRIDLGLPGKLTINESPRRPAV